LPSQALHLILAARLLLKTPYLRDRARGNNLLRRLRAGVEALV
jgi:hypothetical protein